MLYLLTTFLNSPGHSIGSKMKRLSSFLKSKLWCWQSNFQLVLLQSDWGREYRKSANHFVRNGIDTILHVLKLIGKMILWSEPHTSYPCLNSFEILGFCVWHCNYLINSMPLLFFKMNLPWKFSSSAISLSNFKSFGCTGYPFLRAYNNIKFKFHFVQYVSLSYNSKYHGYRCFNGLTRCFYYVRIIKFDYSTLCFTGSSISSTPPILSTCELIILPQLILQTGTSPKNTYHII